MITVSRLTEVGSDTVQELHGLMQQLRPDSKLSIKEGDIETLVKNESAILIVAKDDDKIVGLGSLYIIPKIGKRVGHVEDVVVDEAYRGKGLGEKIVQTIIVAAKEHKLHSLSLTSRPERIAGNKLYQKVGFQRKETNVYRLEL
jgi:ribosomal protein S18 acetylase RimI-like enzyme